MAIQASMIRSNKIKPPDLGHEIHKITRRFTETRNTREVVGYFYSRFWIFTVKKKGPETNR